MQWILIVSILLLFLSADQNPLHWSYNPLMGRNLDRHRKLFTEEGVRLPQEKEIQGEEIAAKELGFRCVVVMCWN